MDTGLERDLCAHGRYEGFAKVTSCSGGILRATQVTWLSAMGRLHMTDSVFPELYFSRTSACELRLLTRLRGFWGTAASKPVRFQQCGRVCVLPRRWLVTGLVGMMAHHIMGHGPYPSDVELFVGFLNAAQIHLNTSTGLHGGCNFRDPCWDGTSIGANPSSHSDTSLPQWAASWPTASRSLHSTTSHCLHLHTHIRKRGRIAIE